MKTYLRSLAWTGGRHGAAVSRWAQPRKGFPVAGRGTAVTAAAVLALCATLGARPGWARGTEIQAVGQPSVQSLADGAWLVTATVHSGLIVAVNLRVEADATVGWSAQQANRDGAALEAEEPVACGAMSECAPVRIRLQRQLAAASPPESDRAVLHLRLQEATSQVDSVHVQFYFEAAGDELKAVSAAEHLAPEMVGTEEQPAFAAVACGAQNDEALRNLPPWRNPEVLLVDRVAAAQQAGVPLDDVLGHQASALTPGAAAETGCSAQGGGGDLPCGGLLLVLGAGAWLWLRRRHRSGRRLVAASLAAGFLVLAAAPAPAGAVTHYVYGYLAFWDARVYKSNDPGARRPWCDTSDTTCVPTDGPDCCFRGVPRVTVQLRRGSYNGTVVSTTSTSSTGFFVMSDPSWQSVNYYISVSWTRTGYPGTMIETNETSQYPYLVYLGTPIDMSDEYTYISRWSVNSAGDSTSTAGGLASAWHTAHDVFLALEAEGDTRLRREYGSGNSYDQITMRVFDLPTGDGFAYCDDSMVQVDWAVARSGDVAHELGHLYHGRVVGCTYDAAAFPTYWASAWASDTGEGNSIGEALASLTEVLSTYDPDLADTTDLEGTCGWTCFTWTHDAAYYTTFDNSNDASAVRNNWRALWEFIDTDTGNHDPGYDDLLDIDLGVLMDTLLDFRDVDGDQGENRTGQEQYRTPDNTQCNKSMDCDPGHVCFEGYCWGGDPHGCNIRDWALWVAVGINGSESTVVETMLSSPCIGTSDDSYPFRGGYRYY